MTSPGTNASRRLPPGPHGVPLLRNALAMRRDQLGFLTAVQRRYGDAATVNLGPGGRFFLFSSPAAVERLLVTGAAGFTSREVNRPEMPFLGDGLLNIDGPEHRRQRALVQPAFGRGRVEAYADTMLAYTAAMLDGWQPGRVVGMIAEMRLLTARIVARCLLGHDFGDGAGAIERAFQAVSDYPAGGFGLPLPRVDLPFTAWGRYRRGGDFVDARMAELIAARRKVAVDRRNGGADGGDGRGRRIEDVLSTLLGAQARGAGPGDAWVRDHVVTFFAAGHETTSNALTYTLLLLSRHPGKRERLLRELRAVCGQRPPAVDELPRLPYLQAVVKEALRLYPPVWVIGRHLRAGEEILGYRLPQGAIVLASQWVMHRLETYWPQSERFLPERWLPGEGHSVVAYSYFPFGAGPRTCLGMLFAQQELHLVLAAVLQRYLPEALPGEGDRLQPRVTLRPVGGVRMRLLPARA